MAVYNLMAKSQLYRGNGTGRDTYISIDNGGMYFPQKALPELPVSTFVNRNQSKAVITQLSGRVNRYNSNGTGRDSYIMSNSGGFELASTYARNSRFEGNLRTYRPPMARTHNSWFAHKYKVHTRLVLNYQQALSRRLSQPKAYN